MLVLTGCTNKKQQLQIDKLETELSKVEQDFETMMEEKDKELSAKDEAMRKLETDTADQIQQLTKERDAATAEATSLKKAAERAEADRLASLPKDASSPGHADFDPARETRFSHAMATVAGDVTTGTGFVVEADGKRYLYTPVGTLVGNSRLAITNAKGDKFTNFGNLEVADGSPFARLELLEAADAPALQLAASSNQVTASTKIACLGLTTSSGAVTGDLSNAFGQSNDTIDLDPNLLVGKVGGPVIDTTTGKVVGITTPPMTERTGLWEDGSTTPNTEVQLKVSRLNRNLTWQPIPVATFLAEAKRITDFDRLTKVAQALATMTITPDSLVLDATVNGSNTAKSILAEAKDFPPAAEATLLNTQLTSKRVRMTGVELKKRVLSMIVSANGHLKRNAEGFDPAKFSAFHRKAAEKSLTWRKETVERLVTAHQTITAVDLTPPSADPPKRDRNKR